MKLKSYFLLTALLISFILAGQISFSQVVVNEYSASNLDEFPDNHNYYEDWIELYNADDTEFDLGGYFLSDKILNPTKWKIPTGTIISAHGFLRFWASGRDEVSGNHYHTNFKLTQTKDNTEHIVLSDPFGTAIQDVTLEITRKSHSRGRTTDGSETWGIFVDPTPNESNNGANVYTAYSAKPVVSDTAGFYTGSLFVTLSTTEPDSEIYYTTNGDAPTQTTTLYTDPIEVTSTTIINARTYSSNPDILRSLIEFNTYFIDVGHTVAVMSTSASQLDDLLNGNQSLRPFGTFEYFNKEGVRTTFGYGEFNEHGQDSWVHDQRSIDYISRDECGYNYAIREELIPLTDRDEFQRIILRAAGDDNYPGIDTSALLRDFFVQNTAEKAGMHLDVRKGEKGVLYVNGDYWGVYGFREKVSDHDFTKYYYGQGKYDIYYLKLWGGSWAEYGGDEAWSDWNDLHDYIKSEDMGDPENFAYVASRFDYKSLVDYIHINSFVVCSDWINWNVGWWRGTNPDGGHQKWGYVLWDEDATFAHYINYTGVPGISPYTSPCYPEGLTSDPEEHIVALNHLLDNEEFKQYYLARYVDLYNTAFHPSSMQSYLDEIEAKMLPEMQMHCDRWGGSVLEWQNNVKKIRDFISERHNYLPEGFEDCWDMTGPYEVTFSSEPEGAGEIQINSITPELPWGGSYFGGIETQLTAIETDQNYEFDKWILNNHTVLPNDSTKRVSFEFETGDNIVALFKPRLYVDSLIINEIMYNPADGFDTEDWVEFYNPHQYPLDITGWQFKDEDDEHVFEFPENTFIESLGYIVISKDTAVFKTFYPEVTNVLGDMDFGMSGGGELIRLFNNEGVLIDTVHYDDSSPWPTEPDGGGPTLELIAPMLDNALAENWMASAGNGTPGAMNSLMVTVPEQPMVEKVTFKVYPNPMRSSSIIYINSGKNISNGQLIVYNVYGTEVMRISNIYSNRIKIERDGLPEGLYIFRFIDNLNGLEGSGKLMVK